MIKLSAISESPRGGSDRVHYLWWRLDSSASRTHPNAKQKRDRGFNRLWPLDYEKGRRKYPVLVNSVIANAISMRKMLLRELKQIHLYILAEVRMGVRLLTVSFGRLNALFC